MGKVMSNNSLRFHVSEGGAHLFNSEQLCGLQNTPAAGLVFV